MANLMFSLFCKVQLKLFFLCEIIPRESNGINGWGYVQKTKTCISYTYDILYNEDLLCVYGEGGLLVLCGLEVLLDELGSHADHVLTLINMFLISRIQKTFTLFFQITSFKRGNIFKTFFGILQKERKRKGQGKKREKVIRNKEKFP